MQFQGPIQGSLFEEDYLIRTLGAIVSRSDLALTELVANAWDAGASLVSITIPQRVGEDLTVEDDGVGITPEQFRQRWMTLGYNRLQHQGPEAEFPPDRQDWHRRAYGQYGMGRHSMLCFADEYKVDTWRDGMGCCFTVQTESGPNPFVLVNEERYTKAGHGTRLVVEVRRNLPGAEQVLEVLSARFLSDPNFQLSVNGRTIPLSDMTNVIEEVTFEVAGISAHVYVVDATRQARTTLQHGVAFWVNRRLVGLPSWTVGNMSLLDGRTREAKRHTIIVEVDQLIDEVLTDWSGFKPNSRVEEFQSGLADRLGELLADLFAQRVETLIAEVIDQNNADLVELPLQAQAEILVFLDVLTGAKPTISHQDLSVGIEAAMAAKKARTRKALMEKISKLGPEDVAALDRILGDWSVSDIRTVLDEIDDRLETVHALDRFSSKPDVDELHVLHPLVVKSRWLFGPEYDSMEFAANTTIQKAIETVFGQKVEREAFDNWRKRPDLLTLADSSLCAVATEEFGGDRKIPVLKRLLLIELKRGGSRIGKDAMRQIEDYIEELLGCGLLDGPPYIHAIVVGHGVDPRAVNLSPKRIGNPTSILMEMVTYSQLVRAAEIRLFNLRNQLRGRYDARSDEDILQRIRPMQEKVRF